MGPAPVKASPVESTVNPISFQTKFPLNLLTSLLANSPRILAECAVAERLRRLPEVVLHPTLFNSPLVYGPDPSRNAMAAIYREYLEVARLARLPLLLTAPTWRLDATRVAEAGVPASIVADAVSFVMARRDEAPPDQPPVAIGGLIGPRSDCYRPDLAPPTREAEIYHQPQIDQLVAAGVDLLSAQTMPSVAEAAGIARAIATTGVPCVISFCTGTDGRVLDGTPLPEAMACIDALCPQPHRPIGYFVNCTHPRFLLSAYRPGDLTRLIGIQANGSSRDVTQLDGATATVADPVDSWAAAMLELQLNHQVSILGGCCGTNRTHLEALAAM